MRVLFLIIVFSFVSLNLFSQSAGGFGFRRFNTYASMAATTVVNTDKNASRRAYVHDTGLYYIWDGTKWIEEKDIVTIAGMGAPLYNPTTSQPYIALNANGDIYTWDGVQWNLQDGINYLGKQGIEVTSDSILLGGSDSMSSYIYSNRYLNFADATKGIIIKGNKSNDDLSSSTPYISFRNRMLSGDPFGARINFIDSIGSALVGKLDIGTYDGGSFLYSNNWLNIAADTLSLSITRLQAPNVIDSTHVKPGGLRGTDINQMSASINQVLGWNGSTWTPITVAAAGDTINIYNSDGDITGVLDRNVNLDSTVSLKFNFPDGNNILVLYGGDDSLATNGSWTLNDPSGEGSISGEDGIITVIEDNGFFGSRVTVRKDSTLVRSYNLTGPSEISVKPQEIALRSGSGANDVIFVRSNSGIYANTSGKFEANADSIKLSTVADVSKLTNVVGITNGGVLKKMDGNEGDVLTYISGSWTSSPSAGGADDWGNQVVVKDSSLVNWGTVANPLGIRGYNAASNGQVPSKSAGGITWITVSGTDSQVVDTFNIASNILRLSLSNDAQPFKSVDLSPYLDNTDSQTLSVDSAIIGNNERFTLAISGGNQITFEVPQVTDTDNQTLDTFTIVSNVLRASLTDDGVPFKSVDLSSYLDNTDDQKIDTFSYSSGIVSLSLESDGQPAKTINISALDTDDQGVDTFTIVSNTLRLSLEGDNEPFNSVSLAPYINTDSQGISITGAGPSYTLDISGGNDVVISGSGIVTLSESPANTLVITGTEVDGSITNEIQTIDTFTIVGNTLRNSLSNDNQPYKSVDLSPYLDNTDAQTLAIDSAIVGPNERFAISISNGNTIRFDVPQVTDTDNQQVDTFSYSAGVITLSLQDDGQPAKTINISALDTDNQQVDTFTISSNILRLSIQDDGVPFNSVNLSSYLDNTDSQTIDTFALVGNTLRSSLSGDNQPFKSVDLSSYLDNTDGQTLSIDSTIIGNNERFDISISNGNTVRFNVPQTTDTDNQKTDTFAIVSNILRLSLEDDAEPFKSVNLSPYLDNTDDQVVDTFTYSAGVISLSVESDGQPAKTVNISGIDTDNQQIDTFELSGNTIRLSLQDDGQPFKTISLSSYLDNTDSQNLTYSSTTGIMSISGGTGDTINTMVGATGVIAGEKGLVPKPLSGDNILFLRGDGTWANPTVGGDNWGSQVVQRDSSLKGNGTSGSVIGIKNYSTASIGEVPSKISSGIDWVPIDTSTTNEIQQIDTFAVVSNILRVSLSSDGVSFKSVNLSGYLDNTDAQTFTNSSDATSHTVTISGSNNSFQLVEGSNITLTTTGTGSDGIVTIAAGSGTTDLTYSGASSPVTLNSSTGTDVTITAGTGISLTGTSGDLIIANTGIITEVDGSVTNEIQRLDTFTITSNVLRASLLNDAIPFSSVDLSPYLDNTDDQKVDTFSISGTTVSLSLESDAVPTKTIDITESVEDITGAMVSGNTETGITVTYDDALGKIDFSAVDGSITNEIQTIDTFSLTGNIINLSLINDGQPAKTINLASINTDAQVIDTFTIVSNILRSSISGDNQPFKSVDLSPYLDNTDAQNITVGGTGPTYTIDISGGSGITVSGAGIITLSESPANTLVLTGTEVDGSISNEIQTLDTFSIVSNVLRASLSNDAVPFKSVDLSPYLDNTDDQTIDTFSYSTGIISLSLESDGQPAKTVNISGIDTDNQQVDTFTIVSNVLRLSLQDDGQIYKSVNLSSYLDNTDGQTLSLDSNTVGKIEKFYLSISGGNTVRFDVPQGNGIYGTGIAGSGSDALPPGGSVVDVDGDDPLIFDLDASAGQSNRMVRLQTDYSADDSYTNYIQMVGPADSLILYSFDDGTYLEYEGTTGSGEGFVISSNTILKLAADSILMTTLPAKSSFNYIIGLGDGNSTLSKVQGTSPNQVLKWNGTKWVLGTVSSTNIANNGIIINNDTIQLGSYYTTPVTSNARNIGPHPRKLISGNNDMGWVAETWNDKSLYSPYGWWMTADSVTLVSALNGGTPARTWIETYPGSYVLSSHTASDAKRSSLTISNGSNNSAQLKHIESGYTSIAMADNGGAVISSTGNSKAQSVTADAQTLNAVVISSGTGTPNTIIVRPDSTAIVNRLSYNSDISGTFQINSLVTKAFVQNYIDTLSTISDNQQVDTFTIVSNVLRLSLQDDAQPFKSVSLTPYLDNTDAQTVDTFSLSGTTLSLSVLNDAQPAKTVSFSGWDTDASNDVTGSGVSGRVAVWNGTQTQSSDANLTWGSNTLTIGPSTPITITNSTISRGANVKIESTIGGIDLVSFQSTGVRVTGSSYDGSASISALSVLNSWSASSGSNTYNGLNISPSINSSGSASGLVTGINLNSTLTSITGGYRGINIGYNTSGAYGIYQGGALVSNYFAGQVGIGTTPSGSNILTISGGQKWDFGSDATGDIYMRNGSGVIQRLPIGTAAQVLTVSGGLPSWQNSAAGADNWGTQVVVKDSSLVNWGTSANPLGIRGYGAASNGQIPSKSTGGITWISNGVLTADQGLSLSGDTVRLGSLYTSGVPRNITRPRSMSYYNNTNSSYGRGATIYSNSGTLYGNYVAKDSSNLVLGISGSNAHVTKILQAKAQIDLFAFDSTGVYSNISQYPGYIDLFTDDLSGNNTFTEIGGNKVTFNVNKTGASNDFNITPDSIHAVKRITYTTSFDTTTMTKWTVVPKKWVLDRIYTLPYSGDVSGTYNNLQLGTGVVGSTEITDASITYGDLSTALKDSLAVVVIDNVGDFANYPNTLRQKVLVWRDPLRGGVFVLKQTGSPNGATVFQGTPSINKWVRVTEDDRIDVKWFGAVGDGTTDDAIALQAWANFIGNNNGHGYLSKGTYLTTATTTIDSMSQVTISGDGPDLSIIKRKANTALSISNPGGSLTRLLRIDGSGGDKVSVYNIGFDGNSANQGSPDSATAWQQYHSLYLIPSGSLGFEYIDIHDVNSYNPLGDGIGMNGSSADGVGEVNVNNVFEYNRSYTRSTITLTANFNKVNLTNIIGTSVQVEPNGFSGPSTTYKYNFNLTNSSLGELDVNLLGARSAGRKGYANISNVYVKGRVVVQEMETNIDNSQFYINEPVRLAYGSYRINNCLFYADTAFDNTTGDFMLYQASANPTDYAYFNNCDFKRHSSVTLDYVYSDDNGFGTNTREISFKGCRFGDATNIIRTAGVRSGKFIFDGCVHSYATASSAAINYRGSAAKSSISNEMHVYNNKIENNTAYLVGHPLASNIVEYYSNNNKVADGQLIYWSRYDSIGGLKGPSTNLRVNTPAVYYQKQGSSLSATNKPNTGKWCKGDIFYYAVPINGWIGVVCDTSGNGDGSSATGSSTGAKFSYFGQVNEGVSSALAGDVSGEPNANVIGNDKVTNAKLNNMAANTFKVRNSGSSGDPLDAAVSDFVTDATPGAGEYVVGFDSSGAVKKFNISGFSGSGITQLTGDVTATGPGSAAATIADNSVDGTDIALGSDAQGDIMYYNGTDWVRLGAGTSGYVLKTQGAGANPIWDAAGSGTTDGSGVDNQVAVWLDANTLEGNTTFLWDGSKLAVGSTTFATSSVVTTQGTGASTSTFGLTHKNNVDATVFQLRDDGSIAIGSSNTLTLSNTDLTPATAFTLGGASVQVTMSSTQNSAASVSLNASGNNGYIRLGNGNVTLTSGSKLVSSYENTFNPTSGTGTFTALRINNTVNQTGGASGIARGILVAPTLTAAADYRGIEVTTNSSHYSIFSTAGKVRFDLGSDANYDLFYRSATGELTRLANGTTGQVLTSTTGNAPSWSAPSGGTISEYYVTSQTGTSINLSTGTLAATKGTGTLVNVDLPSGVTNVELYKNGIYQNYTDGTTTRDWSYDAGTDIITLTSAAEAGDVFTIKVKQ